MRHRAPITPLSPTASRLALGLALAALPLLAPATAAPVVQDDAALPATDEGEIAPEGIVARGIGSGAGLGVVTEEELDEVVLWRHGKTQAGEATLRQILDVRVLEHLARERGLEVDDVELNARFAELDAEARASGQVGGLTAYLEESGVDLATFRDYLRLSILHERLTRNALGLADDAPLTAEQQETWLRGEHEKRGFERGEFPFENGVVATSGEIQITRDEYVTQLRASLDPADLAETCFLILLERSVAERMPDLGPDGVEAALDQEIDRRRAEAAADPRYQGVAFEQLLEAKGLSIEAMRRDPAIRSAALAHVFVNRANDDEALRGAYEAERDFFDGLFGEGVEVRALMLAAAERANELQPRTYEQADRRLLELRRQVEGPEDFVRLVQELSEDRNTRENGGLIGVVTRGMVNLPEAIRAAVFDHLADREGSVAGNILGPVHIQGGSVLLMLGKRRPAPSWQGRDLPNGARVDGMRDHVHRELRRRFLEDALPRGSVQTIFQTN